jgi:hypothetical protein
VGVECASRTIVDEAGLAACGMGLGVGGGLVWLECWIVSLLPFGLTTPGTRLDGRGGAVGVHAQT